MSVAHLGFPTETVVVFVVMAVGAMFIDLFMHRHDKPVSLKSAAMWSIFWVMMAMAFAGFLYVHHGAEMASLFLTGYALEEVLSVDNLFVMMAIFAWFGVPDKYRHRVLYWGVLGAIVFRGIFRGHWDQPAEPGALRRGDFRAGRWLDGGDDAQTQ
jgi:tellurite resistance protein TerC